MNADITYCINNSCPLGPTCARRFPPEGEQVSWTRFEPTKHIGQMRKGEFDLIYKCDKWKEYDPQAT